MGKQKAAVPPAVSTDANGNERWQREGGLHIDELIPYPGEKELKENSEDQQATTSTTFLWFRNSSLKVLNLANNMICDNIIARDSISMGRPHTKVILKGNPICGALLAGGGGGYKDPSSEAVLG